MDTGLAVEGRERVGLGRANMRAPNIATILEIITHRLPVLGTEGASVALDLDFLISLLLVEPAAVRASEM